MDNMENSDIFSTIEPASANPWLTTLDNHNVNPMSQELQDLIAPSSIDNDFLFQGLAAFDCPSQLLETPQWQSSSTLTSSQPINIPTPAPTRTLPRRRSRYLRRALAIPEFSNAHFENTQWDLDPMQRWQSSPPETEPASLSAIAGALRTSSRQSRSTESLRSQASTVASSATSSGEISRSSKSRSIASSRSNSSREPRPKSRNITKHVMAKKQGREKFGSIRQRIFQCTFCCDVFKSKYDWSRHEKSLHLCLEKWVCAPFGGTVVSPATGQSHCVYCDVLNPTQEHLKTHAHGMCDSKRQAREFSRRDHLVQHLRLVHGLETMPNLDDWKVEAPPVLCRCGFCDLRLSDWQARADHITRHFREGKTMDDWRGSHGFEPAIASQVTNAMPPYLIGQESKTLVPFSATSSLTKDHFYQIQKFQEDWVAEQHNESDAAITNVASSERQIDVRTLPQEGRHVSDNFVQLLTSNLARYARQQMSLGIIPTDEMFQMESRRLLYGNEDGWEQTIADNTEWLSTFRDAHIDRQIA